MYSNWKNNKKKEHHHIKQGKLNSYFTDLNIIQ